MIDSAIFMIEGGRALEMVREYIAERMRVNENNRLLLDELGCERYVSNRRKGTVSGVVFPGDIHPDFRKPSRDGVSYPRKGTAWDKRFRSQVGYREVSHWIAEEFGIPRSIGYTRDDCSGARCIGNFFNECGFLYFGKDGPYAMWAPDVPAEVAKTVAEGYEVEEPAKSFVFNFDGCRRIEKEEWEILVLQRKLKQKQAA